MNDCYGATGSNNNPQYDGRALAALGDVVVVVPNWRLGVLGFLSLTQSDDVPINVGLLDQAESLRWMARNVDAFGGNKSDLVVVGHGSGASALAYHLMVGQGLSDVAPILKAVFMSESPMTRYPVFSRGGKSLQNEHWNTSVQLLCKEAEPNLLSCLRSLPVEELLRRQRAAPLELPQFFPVLPVMWPVHLWKALKVQVCAAMPSARDTSPLPSPVACAEVNAPLSYAEVAARPPLQNFTSLPSAFCSDPLLGSLSQELNGEFAVTQIPDNVTVLLGFSEHEGSDLMDFFQRFFRLDNETNTGEAVRTILALLSFSSAEATDIMDQYFKDAVTASWAEQLLSDLLAVCPVRFYAEYLRKSGNCVLGYVLHRQSADELPRDYAARLLFGSPLVLGASSSEEKVLSREVIMLWATFLKTGLIVPANVSLKVGETAIDMMSFTHPSESWTPDLRKEECERLRPHFSAFMQ
ncbi:hypothetical protein HPB51_027309 [Rhipicephalus microplus]|uniref:Carboxylesterase type B domain-containing protein n=1 Tax=Rhipicephalus microplus TaxID=6941 RepID=A0A9J6D0K1_RHIMP|nr:hypothetical protein HPB51_027309 [Rhipicephalus microplus]